MSSLYKLQQAIHEEFPMLGIEGHAVTADQVMSFIDEYAEIDRKAYLKNKGDGRLSFGKHKGFSVQELCANPKGLSYMTWLLKQQWFEKTKYPEIFEQIDLCPQLQKNWQ
tara:strand:+ start:1279 stop:1608 length:330 start_codon:yes stop_codon:yes gene_type:complete